MPVAHEHSIRVSIRTLRAHVHQREILWLPLSFVEPNGPPTVEAVCGGGVITVYSVRGADGEELT